MRSGSIQGSHVPVAQTEMRQNSSKCRLVVNGGVSSSDMVVLDRFILKSYGNVCLAWVTSMNAHAHADSLYINFPTALGDRIDHHTLHTQVLRLPTANIRPIAWPEIEVSATKVLFQREAQDS